MTVGPVLAVDVGTSSVRVAVVTPEAEVLDDVRAARTGDPGRSFDADALWSTITASIAALRPDARSAVTLVSVAAHLGTVLMDAQLRVVGPGSGWSDAGGVAALAAALGDDRAELLRRTGRPVPAAGPLAALLAARAGDDPVGRAAALAVSPGDFVVARLTATTPADVATDLTSAAYTGALDVATLDWSEAVLDRTGVDPAALGRLARSVDVVGSVRDDVARTTGIPLGLPVVAGGPDGTVGLTFLLAGTDTSSTGSSSTGSSSTDTGSTDTGTTDTDSTDTSSGVAPEPTALGGAVGDVAGTTDVLAVRTGSPEHAPANAVVNPFPLGGWTVGGPTGTTGGAVAHWARLLGHRDTAAAFDALGPQVDSLPLGAEGLRAAVELSGARFPRWDDRAAAGLDGLTERHGPAHVLRAVVEGAARSVAEAVAALPVAHDTPVLLAGGAARSARVARIRAQVLGRPVLACTQPDVTLMGAALVGMLAGGRGPDGALAGFSPRCVEVGPEPSAVPLTVG